MHYVLQSFLSEKKFDNHLKRNRHCRHVALAICNVIFY